MLLLATTLSVATAEPTSAAPPGRDREAAVALARQGHHDEAIVALRAILAASPQDLDVRRDLAVIQTWAGRCDDAVATLAPVAAEPQPLWVAEPIAVCLAALGRTDEGLAIVRSASDQPPGSVDAQMAEGRLLRRAGRWRDARRMTDSLLEAQPENPVALALSAALWQDAGRHFEAFRDAQRWLAASGDEAPARLAAYELMALGAPRAAATLVARSPLATAGVEGARLDRHLRGDLAAQRIRWGWAEPTFEPRTRGHEATAATVELTRLVADDPQDERSRLDLIIAHELAGRWQEILALWRPLAARNGDLLPYWIRKAAAGALLATGEPRRAAEIYRELARERPAYSEAWTGLFWAELEQRHYRAAEAALDALRAAHPDQELAVEVQRGWLWLFAERQRAAQRHFEALFARAPGSPQVREGLATAELWQGWPRRALPRLQDLLTRTTAADPFVDRPGTRIARAGALTWLEQVREARAEAADLLALYPDNPHIKRLRRDLDLRQRPEVRIDGFFNTSDKGLPDWNGQLEVSTALGLHARAYLQTFFSRARDPRYSAADLDLAAVGVSQALGGVGSIRVETNVDRDGHHQGTRARLVLVPGDPGDSTSATAGSWCATCRCAPARWGSTATAGTSACRTPTDRCGTGVPQRAASTPRTATAARWR